ncbi:hypothetical protein ACOJBO_04600 [Rhizobium beringeri]
MGIVKMFLVAEEDDLVFQEKLVDGRHRSVRKVSAEADAPDFGADAAGQRHDIGLGDDLIDENWIAHGNLLADLGRRRQVTCAQRGIRRAFENLIVKIDRAMERYNL